MSHGLFKYYSWAISFLLVTPFILQSQDVSDDFPFQHIEYFGSKQGLAGSQINGIIHDQHGFIWVLTDIALNRFDGYTFRSYGYKIDDPHSLSLGFYSGLSESNDGKLWISSYQQGLYSFDPVQEKFTHYRHQIGTLNSLSNDNIETFTCAGDGTIWLFNATGLEKFDPNTSSSTLFTSRHPESSGSMEDYVSCLIFEKDTKTNESGEKLWIVHAGQGIDLFDTKTGKVLNHFHYQDAYPKWNWGYVLGIKDGRIWIGSDHDVIMGFDTRTGKYVRIPVPYKCQSKTHIKNGSHYVLEDHSGNLWTVTDNNEVVYYDRGKNKYHLLPLDKTGISFVDYSPYLFEDQSQRIWLGTFSGLISIDTKPKNIITCRHDDNDPKSISGNFVYGIKRIRQGQLFVGSTSIQTFDKKTNSFSPFRLYDNGKEINTYGAWQIYQDSKDIVWFSGNFGMVSYNPFTTQQHCYKFKNDSGNLISNNCIGIIEDRKGKYWTATWTNGLYQFDAATSKAQVFNVHPGPNSISTNSTGTVYEDSKGIIYTCAWEGGFVTLDPLTEQFKIYHHDPNDPFSVSNESCGNWIESANGLIWFGTFGAGVGVFNPKTEKFKSFSVNEEVGCNTVSSLISDQKGRFWVGTRGGLSCFTPPEDPFAPDCKINFRHYDISDGLPSNVMNMISAFCDTDGTLYFGTRDAGMFYFHPDDLKDNEFVPPVFITGFSLMNKPMFPNDSNSILKTQIEFTKEIRLNYRQDQVSFTFAALNFIHPEKNIYAYMLEGYDEDWIYTDASKRFANYSNLDPGNYVFKVKGSNNDGVWNENPVELMIKITPPFWQTAWFKIFVVISIAGAAFTFYRYRIGQILILQNIRNKIAADLHDDIGSTLNSISIYSDVAAKDPAKRDHALKMIGESSRKIIDSMSDIVWTINPQNDSFDKIIFRMSSMTHNLLKAKKIDFIFKSDESLNDLTVPMETRRNFYLIFKEALNNLVKYSNASRATVLVSYENRMVTFIMRDNGNGFDSKASFNGNGIPNMKKRAREINALLNIESEVGSGTSIELNLKL